MSVDPQSFLRFLPAIYGRPAPGGGPSFLERYLHVPEALLGRRDGTTEGVPHGLASVIDILPSLLYPRLSFLFPDSTQPLPPVEVTSRDGTPNQNATARNLRALNSYLDIVPLDGTAKPDPVWEGQVLAWLGAFLDWLSGWLAFAAGQNWSVDKRRSVLSALMPLYRQRGTRAGLEAMLRLFIDAEVRITDLVDAPAVVLGEAVLADAYSEGEGVLDAMRPYSFALEIALPTYDFDAPAVLALVDATRALADAEKPLHTSYTVQLRTITFTLGQHSTIGVDTLIPVAENADAPQPE